jgi:hypothetical protein
VHRIPLTSLKKKADIDGAAPTASDMGRLLGKLSIFVILSAELASRGVESGASRIGEGPE